jgi:hypothetical protein
MWPHSALGNNKTTLQVYGLSGKKVHPYITNIIAQSFHSCILHPKS